MNVTIRDEKGRFQKGANFGHPSYGGEKTRFQKGHKFIKGGEKGWFKIGQNLWDKSPLFKTGIWSYRQFKKNKCEDCGSTKNLFIHHIDKNRNNNKLENIKTVCAKCHCNLYHPRIFHGNKYVRRFV